MFYETKLTLGIFPLKLYIPIQMHNLETWFNPQTFFKKSKNNSKNALSFVHTFKSKVLSDTSG